MCAKGFADQPAAAGPRQPPFRVLDHLLLREPWAAKNFRANSRQGAGLVAKRRKRGPNRRRRPRRPMAGMLLHIDGIKHRWLNDERWHDLIVIPDDATSEIYYAHLVEEESTRTEMAVLREVIETRGLFCAL